MRLENVYYIRQKCQSREKYLTSFSCFQVENSLSTYEPHACVVVYSIVARASFQHAEETLNYLWREGYTKEKSVIVVGNKADLARSRMISANGFRQEFRFPTGFRQQKSLRTAALRNRLSGKTSDSCRRVAPESFLGTETETKLVDWVLQSASKGFPINREGLVCFVQKLGEELNLQTPFINNIPGRKREGLVCFVQKLGEELNLQTPFINNIPGRKWFNSFLERHPVITQKEAEFINRARATVTERGIKFWFHAK
ncbi:Ras family [Popillia japonica]|uniref:Ras family n=1 Tax=Popillia japonica TaxID=7064 RepID=A0AAW1KHJ1_POPJA